MGACVSSHHKYSSTMKVHVSSGSNRKLDVNHVVTPCSLTKEQQPSIISDNVAVKPQSVPLHSKTVSRDIEETFFDSQAWLDSDCESDFMSVDGEFTPSRGNTPVHHNFLTGPPQMKDGAPAIDNHNPSVTLLQPSPSLIKKKKRLSELFSESQREGYNCDDENGETGAVGSLEAVTVRGGGLKPKRGRWVEIVQVHGCRPRTQT
ncbi:hypothetical protein M8C21_024313, partial [Ambrosia artemisiifolia]